MKLSISKSLLRYLVVGTAAFSAEYGSFYAMYVGGKVSLYVANSISFGLGLLTSFLLNRMWTFESKNTYNKRAAHQLSYYVILSLINLLLTNLLVGLLKHSGINPRIGKLFAMIITSLWNYILLKTIIFTHHNEDKTAN